MSDRIRPEGEHCRVPHLSDVRLAFKTTQQSLRMLQQFPQPLLNVATFPYCPGSDDDVVGGFADIDKAIGLLELEVATIKAARQNYLAGRSGLDLTEPR